MKMRGKIEVIYVLSAAYDILNDKSQVMAEYFKWKNLNL